MSPPALDGVYRTYQQHDLLLRMLERGPGLHFVPVGFMHALQRLEALLRRPTTATHPRGNGPLFTYQFVFHFKEVPASAMCMRWRRNACACLM